MQPNRNDSTQFLLCCCTVASVQVCFCGAGGDNALLLGPSLGQVLPSALLLAGAMAYGALARGRLGSWRVLATNRFEITVARTGGEPSGAHRDRRAAAQDTAGGLERYTNTGHGFMSFPRRLTGRGASPNFA